MVVELPMRCAQSYVTISSARERRFRYASKRKPRLSGRAVVEEDMNFNQLRAFYEVAKAQSITGAAKRLNVSQPAVSLQIRALENDTGLKFFDRERGRPVLTEAGIRLQGYAERIFAIASEADHELKWMRKEESRSLVIATTKLIAAYYLASTMGAFRSLHSDINMRLDIGENAWAIERVRSGVCDLGIVVNPGSEHFERFPVYTDVLVAILPPAHESACVSSGDIDFERETLILREHGSRTRALAEEALRACNRTPKQIIELADAEAIKRAVRAGIGISIITEQAVKDEIENGILASRPFLDGSTSMSIEIVHRKGRLLAPPMKHFVSAFRSHVAHTA